MGPSPMEACWQICVHQEEADTDRYLLPARGNPAFMAAQQGSWKLLHTGFFCKRSQAGGTGLEPELQHESTVL